MRDHRPIRLALALLLTLAAVPALAQGPPPPPPPPQPLPPPPQPAGNPVTLAKANLGKALFWDEQLSSRRTVACGSCHQAASGGSDPRSVPGQMLASHPGPDGVLATPDDITGSPGTVLNDASGGFVWSSVFGFARQVTGRRAPSHVDAGYAPNLFWDGRAGGTFNDPVTGATILANGGALENQALGPPVSTGEMGHLGRSWSDVATRIASVTPLALARDVPAALDAWIGGRSYAQLFAEAFGSADVTPARIALAIATYERTLFSSQTPFDSVNAGLTTLTGAEERGRQLFGALPCARCHGGGLTSDNLFHYLGVRPVNEDSGRAAVTLQPADLGAFRTPSLRNAALRPSYMHDGRFATLADVVAFYDRGGDFNAPNKSPLITPLNLTPQQRGDLVAFLGRPLTDPRVAAGTAPFDQPTLFSGSGLMPQVLAGGVPGSSGSPPQVVALEPPLLGNAEFTVGVYGGVAGAQAVLVIDDVLPGESGGIPAGGSFARRAITLTGSGATDGRGSVTLALPVEPGQAGRVLYGRWYVSDPGASGGVAVSAPFRMQLFGAHGAGAALTAGAPGVTTPATTRLYASAPNPFRQSTRIRYDLYAAAPVRLVVYDVSGRAVRRLVDQAFQAPGVYEVGWDGRDDAGRAMPGGVYFYRLQAGRQVQQARTVRVD